MRGQVLWSLFAAAAALSTNNLRDARFSCSIVGDSLLAGLVAGGEGGFEPVAKVVVNELKKLILTPVDIRVSAEPLRTAAEPTPKAKADGSSSATMRNARLTPKPAQ